MLAILIKQPAEALRVPLTFPAAVVAIAAIAIQPRGLVPGAPALTNVAASGGAA